MNYEGPLYGKVGRRTFDTGKTSADWDRLEAAVKAAIPLLDLDADLSDEEIKGTTPYLIARRAALRQCQRALDNVSDQTRRAQD